MSKKNYLSEQTAGNSSSGDPISDNLFSAFSAELVSEVSELAGKEYTITCREYYKNNCMLHGISFIRSKADRDRAKFVSENDPCQISPIYYIDEMYSDYIDGTLTVRKAAGMIYRDFKKLDFSQFANADLFDEINNFKNASERTVFRLLNTDSNLELLSKVPHIEFLDLSIVFYYVISVYERGFSGCLVSNDLMESWGTTADELLSIALGNAARMFPPSLRNVNEVTGGESEDPGTGFFSSEYVIPIPAYSCKSSPSPNLYVLTNDIITQGAAALLYKDVLKRCSRALGGDLYILPSSVHEVIFMRAEPDIKVDKLKELVRYMNRNEVAAQDVLSDSVYMYHAESGTIGFADGTYSISPDLSADNVKL